MSWYIKTETFNKETLNSPRDERNRLIAQHVEWVKKIKQSGIHIYCGYLINEAGMPGGGGLLVIKANSYKEAESIIKKDPMIINNLVNWKLQEWIPIS